MEETAERILRRLWVPLAALVVAQFTPWVVQYLTWPWYADHDVFATLALGWDRGVLPYRDLIGNNFPGTIYQFWLIGKVFGWGWNGAFFAIDAALVALLIGSLVAWSLRVTGRALPGLVGGLAAFTFYAGLDFSLIAQRDWQGPLLAAVGLLAVQAHPGRAGRLAAAALLAAGFSIRPQVVLFAPAYLVALLTDRGTRRKRLAGVAEFAAAGAMGVALLFAPLAYAGILGDFIRGVRLAADPSVYNGLSPGIFAYRLTFQLVRDESGLTLVPLTMLLLAAASAEPRLRRSAWIWAAATAGVALYLPLSPAVREYLRQPLRLVWAVDLAVLAALILDARPAPATLRLAALALAIGAGVHVMPTYANPNEAARALPALARGEPTAKAPQGYKFHDPGAVDVPPWGDYLALLEHLRGLPPSTRVVNGLIGAAICGPAARLPALPAESITWVIVVDPRSQARFAEALEDAHDSVVVWVPTPGVPGSIDSLKAFEAAIRRLYEPSARFGRYEVWGRRGEPG